MKKILLLLTVILVFGACKKDDPNAPLKSLVGTEWKLSFSDGVISGTRKLHFVDNKKLVVSIEATGGSVSDMSFTTTYTYNEKLATGVLKSPFINSSLVFEVTQKLLTVRADAGTEAYIRFK